MNYNQFYKYELNLKVQR